MSWYVVKTKARQESRAVDHLTNQDLEVYCPWLVRKNGRREALFTSYLFVRLSSLSAHFHTIKNTRGVLKMLKFGEWWAQVDDQFVEYLRFKENGFRGVPIFEPDQEVIIKDGPFKGVEAIYLCADGEARAMVLLTLLGRKQSVVIEESLLKAI
ncbi:MAG: transcription/translation regulatory transformer protein RfaH [Pseudomonadales bacterium]|nr:transcription/translation regulatory transformer protein RfaH [Pseudomonadales bacterium]RLU03782.1 MAG: transcription/translation regulatory transformer protein RfaH [Ketobacter sp.]